MGATVNIDGIERNVAVVSHNIDGVWRESYNKNKYYVILYAYGKVYDILTCNSGSSVTLPSIPNVEYDDVEHYGWTRTKGNTTRDYAPTASFKPTNSIELHAVFKYKIISDTNTSETTYTVNTNNAGTTNAGVTVNIQDALPNSTYTVTKTPYAAGTRGSGNANGYSVSATWNVVNSGIETSTGIVPDNATISFYESGGASVQLFVGSVSTGSTSYDDRTYKTYYNYINIKVEYTKCTVSYAYRSELGKYSINLYRYGELYQTLNCNKGLPVTLISVPIVQNDDEEHYGWTLIDGNETRDYAPTATFTPTSDIDLYAVFAYGVMATESESLSVSASGSFDTGKGGTISIKNAVPSTSYVISRTFNKPVSSYYIDGSGRKVYDIQWEKTSLTDITGTASEDGNISYTIPDGTLHGFSVGYEGYTSSETLYDYEDVTVYFTGYPVTIYYRSAIMSDDEGTI